MDSFFEGLWAPFDDDFESTGWVMYKLPVLNIILFDSGEIVSYNPAGDKIVVYPYTIKGHTLIIDDQGDLFEYEIETRTPQVLVLFLPPINRRFSFFRIPAKEEGGLALDESFFTGKLWDVAKSDFELEKLSHHFYGLEQEEYEQMLKKLEDRGGMYNETEGIRYDRMVFTLDTFIEKMIPEFEIYPIITLNYLLPFVTYEFEINPGQLLAWQKADITGVSIITLFNLHSRRSECFFVSLADEHSFHLQGKNASLAFTKGIGQ